MRKFARVFVATFTFMIVWGFFVPAISAKPASIVIMTHDSFSAGKKVIETFEAVHNVKIRFLKAGDAGAALNRAILSKANPMADIFFGVDNTFLSRALKADIFESYDSPVLADIFDHLKLDKKNRLLPADFGDVCLNYDKKWFAKNKIKPPEHIEDLIKPEYKGLTVVPNPATSSPGLSFLLTTIGHYGESGSNAYWKKLRENDVLVTGGWKQAYWGNFTAASEGNRPIVVSYATSPPAEVHFSEKPLHTAPTEVIVKRNCAFRQIEFVGILKGTKNRLIAEKLVDFILSTEFQEDIPLQMFVFPANKKAKLPEVFVKHAKIAQYPAQVLYESIEANREKWIETWADTVLR